MIIKMSRQIKFSLLLILFTFHVDANSNGVNECVDKTKVLFTTHDIFDLNDPDTIFLHRWANFLHIKTKEKTLINEAAFFLEKCAVKQPDLDELERHLRNKKYLRDARVAFDKKQSTVNVATWDNWSLLPTIDFGRKGGKNKYAIGIKDRNFLGLGIDVEAESFTNDQRSGYKLKTHFPLYLNKNINARIRLTSNDDGSSESVFLRKDFVSFDTKNAFNLGFHNFTQEDTQYENGVTSNRYQHDQKFATASWQWLHRNSASSTLRFGIGAAHEQHIFANINDAETGISVPSNNMLPIDREFSYPFISMEYLTKDYRKLTNLNLIGRIEDFNLGWHASANIGTDIGNSTTSPAVIWRSSLSKGYDFNRNGLWLFNASFEGESYNDSVNDNRFLIHLSNEYFYKINEQWGTYVRNITKASDNQFKDSAIVLGGETGLRGYPLQYKRGKRSTQFTFEARYYPHINIYKLLEVGAAAFVDTGRIFGQDSLSNDSNKWMTSIGLGARFYSTHSSEARVIHLDIIKPLNSAPNLNSVEFRITTKHSF